MNSKNQRLRSRPHPQITHQMKTKYAILIGAAALVLAGHLFAFDLQNEVQWLHKYRHLDTTRSDRPPRGWRIVFNGETWLIMDPAGKNRPHYIETREDACRWAWRDAMDEYRSKNWRAAQ